MKLKLLEWRKVCGSDLTLTCGCVSSVQVEQHNSHVQHTFAQRVDAAFSNMQHHVQQQESRHRRMLSSYMQAVGEPRGKHT